MQLKQLHLTSNPVRKQDLQLHYQHVLRRPQANADANEQSTWNDPVKHSQREQKNEQTITKWSRN